MEESMLDTDFILINQPHHTPTCYSRAWKMMSTPELAMASGDIEKLTKVCKQLGESGHVPVILQITSKVLHATLRKEPSWNYKKANWTTFTENIEQLCEEVSFTENILLTNAILIAATETIPRGRRKQHY